MAVALGALVAAACGQPPQPANNGGSRAAVSAGPSAGEAATPAGGSAVAGATGALAEAAPELATLNLASVSPAPTSLPLEVADDAGYFLEHGLTLSHTYVSSTVAVQGLVSGSLDLYHGGAATITATLGGADLAYVAATVDRSALMLFGEKGLSGFADFRGKTIGTTAAGAFGEIAALHTARQYGLVAGQDFTFRYHPNSEAVFASFSSGLIDGAVVSPPWNLRLQELGYPMLIDYFQQGLKIIGPAPATTRAFARAHPNTIKAFLRAYLDGTKRALEDRPYATAIYARINRLEDGPQAAADYDEGARVWNKDLRVSPAAVEVVLESSPHPNAKTARASDFYDNTFADEIHATYATRLFPELASQP
jgi:ABC-type nitrate/sulfonate/bicarbonate transport system substrate-binding protein